jgi:hypothetical protein
VDKSAQSFWETVALSTSDQGKTCSDDCPYRILSNMVGERDLPDVQHGMYGAEAIESMFKHLMFRTINNNPNIWLVK